MTSREALLELTYTAHAMAPLARDIGRVDEDWLDLPRSRGRLSPCSVSNPPSVAKFIRLPSSGRWLTSMPACGWRWRFAHGA